MTRLLHLIERWPLGVSILALIASLSTIGMVFGFGNLGFHSDRIVSAMWVLSFCLSCIAVVNLIRAESRGLSSTKIALSVVVLCFAFVPTVCLGLLFLAHIGGPQ
jgi:O-antigen/teichoic acid export membrane protein